MTYTEKELNQFLHGISLSLLSKKSAQHWRYDEETAKEIEWLEVLERKVRADKADRKTEPTTEDFIKGFKCGAERQFEADKNDADRPQGEWIPCGERLPEEREWIGTKKFGTTISDEVLVTFESRGERFVRPIHFQNGELGGMDKHTMDAVHGEWKAVAWMPLPAPWEGERR